MSADLHLVVDNTPRCPHGMALVLGLLDDSAASCPRCVEESEAADRKIFGGWRPYRGPFLVVDNGDLA